MSLRRAFIAAAFLCGLAAPAALAQYADQRQFTTSTGSANAYAVSYPAITGTIPKGVAFRFIPNFSNTGAATIAISGLGAVNLFKPSAGGAVALTGGEIVATPVPTPVEFVYDGTQAIIISNLGAAASGVNGSGSSKLGAPALWSNTIGTTLAAGTWGACDIGAAGALINSVGVGLPQTTTIQAVINTCGMIHVPSPAGGQTYDSQGVPTKCFNIDAALIFNGTLNGGILGDGPSVSCINVTTGSACGIQLQNTFGILIRDVTIRHTGSFGSGTSTPGCGIDAALNFKNDKIEFRNVHTVYNYIGRILGATVNSLDYNMFSSYNLFDAVQLQTSLAGLPATYYGLQWNIISPTMFFNGGHGLYAQCNVTATTLQQIIGMRTVGNGTNTGAGGPFYDIELNGDACDIIDFFISDSFIGEGARGQIWIHSAGTTPYTISNVSIESPGYTCTLPPTNSCSATSGASGIGIAVTTAGGSFATFKTGVPVIIDHVVSFTGGNGFTNNVCMYVIGPNRWSITNSFCQGYLTAGFKISAFNPGSLVGNTSIGNVIGFHFDNGGSQVFSSFGNYSAGNTTANVSAAGVTKSNTGDWCTGTSGGSPYNTAPTACAW